MPISATLSIFDATGRLLTTAQWDAVTFRVTDGTGKVLEERPCTGLKQQAVVEATRQGNVQTLRAALVDAHESNRVYLALPALVTTLQLNAQVRALTQQNQRLIRLAAERLDAAD